MNGRDSQRGSVLAAVMLVLVMGLLLLGAQQKQLDSALLLGVEQRRYLQAYNRASSALNWGLTQSWPPSLLNAGAWRCQRQPASGLQACVKRASRADMILLRGLGEIPAADPLWLYQLAMPDAHGRLRAEPGGWLDFCPEKDAAACED